ncbi:uncharacterized protein TrAtP1_008388 [Trichoderma atroviride]|uniref:uncharacterized protein n=1 Tax=Hypocrea atroviridis TaxID=63577 RepID=UPI003323758A|nr:hypothetical protein TrAtP1_008388 [Trichoderma atroviride]
METMTNRHLQIPHAKYTPKTRNALKCGLKTYLDHKPGKLVARTRRAGSASPAPSTALQKQSIAALLYWHKLNQKQDLISTAFLPLLARCVNATDIFTQYRNRWHAHVEVKFTSEPVVFYHVYAHRVKS